MYAKLHLLMIHPQRQAAINFLHVTRTIKDNLIITGFSTCACDFAVVLLEKGDKVSKQCI